MGLEESFLQELFEDLENDKLVLPTLPEVALKVRDTLEDERASMSDVAKVITSDVALSARLIQVANSPLLRSNHQIETVDAAVTRMGSNMVRNLVTSIAMQQMFQATSDATDQRLRAIWDHSTEIAAISQVLASQFTKLKADQALLAGLVHNIGALPILTRAEDYHELVADIVLLDRIISNAQAKIGNAILSKWNFPEELIAVVTEHHDLQRDHDGDADFVDVVIVADLQSRLGTDHPHAQVDLSTVPAFAKLGMEPDVSIVDMDEAHENIESVKAALAG